jgi:hypothetical protein
MVCTKCGMIGADVQPDWSPHVNKRVLLEKISADSTFSHKDRTGVSSGSQSAFMVAL